MMGPGTRIVLSQRTLWCHPRELSGSSCRHRSRECPLCPQSLLILDLRALKAAIVTVSWIAPAPAPAPSHCGALCAPGSQHNSQAVDPESAA